MDFFFSLSILCVCAAAAAFLSNYWIFDYEYYSNQTGLNRKYFVQKKNNNTATTFKISRQKPSIARFTVNFFLRDKNNNDHLILQFQSEKNEIILMSAILKFRMFSMNNSFEIELWNFTGLSVLAFWENIFSFSREHHVVDPLLNPPLSLSVNHLYKILHPVETWMKKKKKKIAGNKIMSNIFFVS